MCRFLIRYICQVRLHECVCYGRFCQETEQNGSSQSKCKCTAPLTNFLTVYAFSQKLQHIGDNLFLLANIQRILITALELPQLKRLLIYGLNMENINFHTFLEDNA